MDLEWIRKGLSKPGKTQAGLAKAIGRSESVASRILSGEREIKSREIPKIEAYLGDSPNGHAKAMPSGGLPTPEEIAEARKVQEILLKIAGVPQDDKSLAASLEIVRRVKAGS